MTAKLEFFFDYVSPTAYLAAVLAPQVAERTGAQLEYRPFFLGGVMAGTGNQPPGTVVAKGAYLSQDLIRCAKHIGVPFHFNPAFPMTTRTLTRATIALEDDPAQQKNFMDACWRRMWGQTAPMDLSKPENLQAMCVEEGFNYQQIVAWGDDEAMKARLVKNTEEAIGRGAFGAPTFFVGEEMFFGHDRLDYAERALVEAMVD